MSTLNKTPSYSWEQLESISSRTWAPLEITPEELPTHIDKLDMLHAILGIASEIEESYDNMKLISDAVIDYADKLHKEEPEDSPKIRSWDEMKDKMLKEPENQHLLLNQFEEYGDLFYFISRLTHRFRECNPKEEGVATLTYRIRHNQGLRHLYSVGVLEDLIKRMIFYKASWGTLVKDPADKTKKISIYDAMNTALNDLIYDIISCNDNEIDIDKAISTMNEKLKARYPNAFSNQAALFRDHEKEDEAMKKSLDS
jgi:hypothetical protein